MTPEHRRIDDLRRRVEKDPASIAFAQLAEEHRRGGEYQEAIRICRAGLQLHPGYLSARVTLGRALIELGQLDAAQGELEQVLRVAPDNLAAVRALASIRDSGSGTRDPIHDVSIPNLEPRIPSPESRILLQLESWLAAIVADRKRRG